MNTPKQQSLKMVIAALIGLGIGSMSVWQFSPVASRCQILYVAQDEIIKLENERTLHLDPSHRELFFGEIERAVSLATSLPKAYEDKVTKVVYSMSAVSGDKVRSISKEIHQQIIAELSKNVKLGGTDKASNKPAVSNKGEGSTRDIVSPATSASKVGSASSDDITQDLSDYNLKAKDSEGKNE